jgi:hypothetical protein
LDDAKRIIGNRGRMSVLRYIPPQLTPMFVDGKWKRPAISAMKKAKMRKRAILSNK